MKYNTLTPFEENIIINKGTEAPFSGEYHDNKQAGDYLCKQCNTPLFHASAKFDSGTGWPSFDDDIDNSVKRIPDADGMRVEIVCGVCDGHLGHVFEGEGFTDKMTRHCVNSASINFIKE